MVKRTVVVLSILSLLLVAAGTHMAFAQTQIGMLMGASVGNRPLYVATECPPVEQYTTIVKKWQMKIEGPAPLAACGSVGPARNDFLFGPGPGLLGGLAAALPTPMDWLFGGGGVYGCTGGLGGTEIDREDCGPCFGPLPGAVAMVPKILAAPTTVFGALW
jgi:hypothetical protein